MRATTYGTAKLIDGHWALYLAPHVALRVKRIFPRSRGSKRGEIVIVATDEVAYDIAWLMDRWPLEISDEDRAALDAGVAAYELRHRELEQILVEGVLPPRQRPIVAAATFRHYQDEAAAVTMSSGGLLLADDVGVGKAQPLDADVLTPTGFRKMGDLAVGDLVCSPSGAPVPVTAIHDQGVLDEYVVTFSDGSQARCNDEHLWRVRSSRRTRSKTTGEQNPAFWQNLTLAEIVQRGLRTSTGQARFHIPIAAAADLTHGLERLVDPYLLGLLLGDGGLTEKTVKFSTADDELIEAVRDLVPDGITPKRCSDAYTYRLAGRPGYRNRLITELKALGLMGHHSVTKFVPAPYLHAPATDRLALLQGLMDADGYAKPHGSTASAQFYSSSPQLAADVVWITRSLGGVARLTSKMHAGRERYTITVKLPQPLNPFRLQRKAQRWGDGHAYLRPTRAIVDVHLAGRSPMRCISVDSPDGLYITNDFIVTHNTHSAMALLTFEDRLPAVWVTLTNLVPQAVEMLTKTLPTVKTYVPKKMAPPVTPAGIAAVEAADIVVLNYHKLASWQHFLRERCFTLIFDEAHELRRVGSDKYNAAAHLARRAEITLGLTATPVYNYGDEVWAVLDIIQPGVLGSRDEFMLEWGNGSKSVGNPKALGEYLRDQGLMLRRTREDVGRQLPPIQEIEHVVSIDHDEVYDMADVDAIVEKLLGDDPKERFHAGGEFDFRMRHATGVSKAPEVAAFTRIIAESEPVILFGWHHDVYDIWMKELQDFRPALYTGRQSLTQKEEAKRRFLARETNVLIMSLRAGAGLDGLQEVCSVAVFGELDWSPAMHTQCLGRIHRDREDGSLVPVVGFYVVANDGADPFIAEVLDVKGRQAKPLLDPDTPLFAAKADNADRLKAMAQAYRDRRR